MIGDLKKEADDDNNTRAAEIVPVPHPIRPSLEDSVF
jgi:hypothetical protein